MKPADKSGLSIFARLLIAFLLVNIATAISLIFSGYKFTNNAVEKRTKEAIAQQVTAIANHFNQEYRVNLNRAMDDLTASSELNDYLLTSITRRIVTSKKLERLFKLTIADYEGYEAISFVDLEGRAMVNVVGKSTDKAAQPLSSDGLHGYPGEPAVTAAAAFQMFQEASVQPMLNEETAWEMPPRKLQFYGPYIEKNGDIKALAGHTKIDLDTGDFGGLVLVRLNLNGFFAYLRGVRFFDANPVWVLDVDGEVLQQPENSRITFDPRSALPSEIQPVPKLVSVDEGMIAYQDFAVSENQPFMRVAVSIPSSLLLKDLAPTAQFFSLVLIISMIVVLLVSLYVSRYLTRPVVELANAAERLASGDLGAQVAVQGSGEVRTLVTSFNAMTEELRISADARERTLSSLEIEVAERTRAEQELKQQALDLEAARKAAEAGDKTKGQFLATMSHEIRTPINGVLGMTELLLHTELTDKQTRFAESTRRSGEALLGIINDILDFSEIEAGKLDLERMPFDLRELIDDMGQLFAGNAHSKGLELICSLPHKSHTALIGDVGRLRQVLTNLLGNSIKFTETGEVALRVTTDLDEELSALVKFEVVDTGIGIDDGAQQKIFKSFEQADVSTTRRYGGTGLGLAISKQLVELMGGEIGVSSELGRGSSFWFTAKFEKRAGFETSQDLPQRLEKLKVLAVDDNPSNRDILDNQLEGWGIEHVVSDNPLRALDILREAVSNDIPFDAALLDMHMPDMDGMELARTIKADPALARLRLMMLSSVSPGDETERRAVGIELHLPKPIRQSDLYNALLTLVATQCPVSTPAKPALQQQTKFSGRVLVAEDNAVNQEMARGSLNLLGLESVIVDDGQAALETLERQAAFDIVLMDCRMPRMDGFAATKAIRQREADAGNTHHLPIIALTANALAGDKENCLKAGIDDYLSKPFTVQQLSDLLSKWMTLDNSTQAHETPDSTSNSLPAPVLDEKDLDTLRTLDQGSQTNVFEKIIGLFIETSAQLMQDLRDGVAGNDALVIENAAHTLKSSSANMGAMELTALCKDLEHMGREKNMPNVADVIAQAGVELDRACRALNSIRESEAA